MAKIIGVDKSSISYQLGIKSGDNLLSFDGNPVKDILDYHYYDGMEEFVMTVSRGEQITDYEIEKDYDESLGLELDESMELTPLRCKNKCKFCFVDQLPKGMSESLYVKDDDYRLSFVSGNYITLTNVFKEELDRIVRLHLSPLYVSVHTTDNNIKNQLVTNPEGSKTFEKLKFLTDNGIQVNTQIVMCPNENDGEVLLRTLEDLQSLRPMLKSVAVVPVGLTKHREGLYPLMPVDKEKARQTITLIDSINKKYGVYVYPSDEFYIKAELPLPNYEDYGDFEQIENGVGLVRMFEYEVDCALNEVKKNKSKAKVSLITGASFWDFLQDYCGRIESKLKGLQTQVIKIKNEFFGETVTVAGLITAGDIIKQCKGKLYKNVIIPSTMLKEFTTTFLDGMSVKEVEQELGVKLHICRNGEHLVQIIAKL